MMAAAATRNLAATSNGVARDHSPPRTSNPRTEPHFTTFTAVDLNRLFGGRPTGQTCHSASSSRLNVGVSGTSGSSSTATAVDIVYYSFSPLKGQTSIMRYQIGRASCRERV